LDEGRYAEELLEVGVALESEAPLSKLVQFPSISINHVSVWSWVCFKFNEALLQML
jgi:hypothetical protein